MKVLSVREYDRRIVSSEPGELQLTHDEVALLHRTGEQFGIRILNHTGPKEVQFNQFVGVVQIGDRLLEILPKIEPEAGDVSVPTIRHNLLSMLLIANDLAVWEADKTHLGDSASSNWLDILISLFCHSLTQQIRKGMARRYRTDEDDLHVVRGRLLLDEQLRRNSINRERLAVEFDELDENHAVNQIFKLALTRMLRVAQTWRVQQEVRELLMPFQDVTLREYHPSWVSRVSLDRLTRRFEFCLGLARLFLNGLSPDFSQGRHNSFALLFDMNELFEKYIGKLLRRVTPHYGLELKLQHARHYLLRDDKDPGANLFQIKPDIVIFSGENAVCIADTKWKRLSSTETKLGISQSDVYQMLTYASRYDCHHLLLLYPFHRLDGASRPLQERFSYQGNGDIQLTVAQICLSKLDTVPDQLRGIIDGLGYNQPGISLRTNYGI